MITSYAHTPIYIICCYNGHFPRKEGLASFPNSQTPPLLQLNTFVITTVQMHANSLNTMFHMNSLNTG